MKRIVFTVCFLLIAGGIFWRYPLFHIVRLDDDGHSATRELVFNAKDFADSFWIEQLVPSLNQAPEAALLLTQLSENPHAAGEKFGRKVGMGRNRMFILRGSGTVVRLDKHGVGLSLEPAGTEPDVVLFTGMLFGNMVRDATGLLEAGEFSNSQHFNDISTELNRIVEERVMRVVKEQAAIGRELRFIGCAEAPGDAGNFRPLTVIPLEVHLE